MKFETKGTVQGEITEDKARELANRFVEKYGEPFPAISYAMAIQKYLKGELEL